MRRSEKLKPKQATSSRRAAERESPAPEEGEESFVPPEQTSSASRQTGTAQRKRDTSGSSMDRRSSSKKPKGAGNNPHVYKSIHNIGRRKAAEHVVSYKETEIAVCFKDSYWPNARLDFGGYIRGEPTKEKCVPDRSLSSPGSSREGQKLDVKKKQEKLTSPDLRKESKSDSQFSATGDSSFSSQLTDEKEVLQSPRSTQRKGVGSKTSQVQKRALRVSDDDGKKAGDDEVEAILAAAAAGTSTEAGSNDDGEEAPTKWQKKVKLSSKKRAELSFLAHGVSASGGSGMLSRKSKNGDQQQRVRRTASLNAGAIVSLMLQKDEPAAKKDRLRWNDGDDSDDDDDSTSISSESMDSTFSEYSAPGESKLSKKSVKAEKFVDTPTTGSLVKAVTVTDSMKVSSQGKLTLPAAPTCPPETSTPKAIPNLSRELAMSSLESATSSSSLQKTNFGTEAEGSVQERQTSEPGQDIPKALKKSSTLPTGDVKDVSPNLPSPDDVIVVESRGKRKRKDHDGAASSVMPGKRMASLNAQAILAASRDDRLKRSRLSEGSSKIREFQGKCSSSGERSSFMFDPDCQSKSSKKSCSISQTSMLNAASASSSTESHSTKSASKATPIEGRTVETAALAVSTGVNNSGERVHFPGAYGELVSPPSSVQLVEMTSAPVLTPNKTYQQLDRPQNCQQYSSNRQAAPVWTGSHYPVTQLSDMHSSNGHPADFNKSSSDGSLDKSQSNVVTALIPHGTSLAPAVPIRFTAHIVPQNPLPQHGFYGQLQPHASYYSDRYAYARPNLFPHPGKAFATGASFVAPHIATDLYNASRQLQAYEVQQTRPVYGRQSDFSLQFCQPQFVGPLTGTAESREQLQQLYRPYLSPPAHQPFQSSQHQTMCAPYASQQMPVALAVAGVNPLSSEKTIGSATSTDTQSPKLTDISYSVKRNNLSSRCKQVETKHSSTQVKSREAGLRVCGTDGGELGLLEKTSPEQIKVKSVKPPLAPSARADKSEMYGRGDVGASVGKMAPPAHCQSYTAGPKPVDGMDLRCSELRSYKSTAHKPCLADVKDIPEKKHPTKQEDSKSSVLAGGLAVCDTKPSTAVVVDPVVPYAKVEGKRTPEALSLAKCVKMGVAESSEGSWPGGVQRRRVAELQTSVIDLSQEKELDLSKKPKAVETQEVPAFEATPLKKKLLKSRKTETDDLTRNAPKSMDATQEGMSVVSEEGKLQCPSVTAKLCNSPERINSAQKSCPAVDNASSSVLSQLETFVTNLPSKTSEYAVSTDIDSQADKAEDKSSVLETASVNRVAEENVTTESERNRDDTPDILKNVRKEKADFVESPTKDDADCIIVDLVASPPTEVKSEECSMKEEAILETSSDPEVTVIFVSEESSERPDLEEKSADVLEPAKEGEPRCEPLSGSVAHSLSSDVIIDLTKSAKIHDDDHVPEEPQADLSSKDQEVVVIESTELIRKETQARKRFPKSGERTPPKKYGHGSNPKRRAESSSILVRKRLNSAGFASRNSTKQAKQKVLERCGIPTSRVAKRRDLKAVAKIGAEKSKKDQKKLVPLRSFSRQKTGLEKDKVQRRFTEEMYRSEAGSIKCWKWKEPGAAKLVYTEVEGPPLQRVCYPSIEHTNGDIVRVRDCVLVRSGMRKKDIPYIAKIYGFWEHQETGEMMMGVFWYYRQHNENDLTSKYLTEEVFASRHRDVIPVACIEDRCYVLTLNEFCRYKAEQKRQESNSLPRLQIVPSTPESYSRTLSQPLADVDPETVFLCRSIYDIKLRRISRFPRKLVA